MVTMTQEQVKAVAMQGWAVRRLILAQIVVKSAPQTVEVVRAWGEGALIRRTDCKLNATCPVHASCLTISEDDAAHLDNIIEMAVALKAGRFFSGGHVSMDHRTNWGAGNRAR